MGLPLNYLHHVAAISSVYSVDWKNYRHCLQNPKGHRGSVHLLMLPLYVAYDVPKPIVSEDAARRIPDEISKRCSRVRGIIW